MLRRAASRWQSLGRKTRSRSHSSSPSLWMEHSSLHKSFTKGRRIGRFPLCRGPVVYTTGVDSTAVVEGTWHNDVHLLLRTILEYRGWKTRVANPEKSCTQGRFRIKGKSKGESSS